MVKASPQVIAYQRRRRARVEAQIRKPVRQALLRTVNRTLAMHDVPGLTSQSIVASFSRPDQLSPLLQFWREEVNGPLSDVLLSVFRGAARDALSTPELGRVVTLFGPEFFDSVRNVRADQYLAGVQNRMMTVSETLFDRSQSALRDALDQGLGVPKTAAAIKEVLGSSIASTPETIARTEAGAAIGAADHAVAEELEERGIKVVRIWTATSDSRTRESHNDADGQQRPVDQPFDVGGASLMYPGDPAGEAEEVINCRCVVTLDVIDDEVLAQG